MSEQETQLAEALFKNEALQEKVEELKAKNRQLRMELAWYAALEEWKENLQLKLRGEVKG